MTMPYIKQSRRDHLSSAWSRHRPENAGELNYIITTIVARYWDATSDYQGINDIVGALEGAKLEFYRRIVVLYEERKIAENGDVY
jgi:hypothetical protein